MSKIILIIPYSYLVIFGLDLILVVLSSSPQVARADYTNHLGYNLSTNIADSNKDRLYTHGFRYRGKKDLNKSHSLSFGLGFTYLSVEQEIIEENDQIVDLSDLSIGLNSSEISLANATAYHLLAVYGVGNRFPLSEVSRNEGYNSVPYVTGGLRLIRNFMAFYLSGETGYVINTYKNSFAGTPNPESHLMGSAGVGIMFQSFQLIYSYQTGVRRFTDGTNLGVSGNRIQLSGRIGKYVNASLETTNSNFIDDQFIDPWFHNPFERRVNFNLGATF